MEKHRYGKRMKSKNKKSNVPVTGRAENGFSDSAWHRTYIEGVSAD